MRVRKLSLGLLLTGFFAAGACGAQGAPFTTDPVLVTDSPLHVSEHVYAIMGFPNVGIIVGSAGTLVVDTGLGPSNGSKVAEAAKKLSKSPKLYLTTTHFHPEHAAGEAGFPAGTILIRPRAQQKELEQDGAKAIEGFLRNPQFAPFLTGVSFRKPDVLFDKEYLLDLGDVHVRLLWLGPAHTKGDEEIFVQEDSTLLTGDLAMKNNPPRNYAQGANTSAWIEILDKLAALQPLHVLPDHGELGDASLISEQRAYLLNAAGTNAAGSTKISTD